MVAINRNKLVTLVTNFHKLFSLSGHFDDSDLNLAIRIAEVLPRWVACESHHGLKRYKAMSNLVVRHLMGTPLESIPLSNRYGRLLSRVIRKCSSSNTTLVKTY